MNPYRQKILNQVLEKIKPYGTFEKVLDFGSGDGWFASMFLKEKISNDITALDVTSRKQYFLKPLLYDGEEIPFKDKTFDLVYSFDVLHHSNNPKKSLLDLLRCSKKYVLLKDHTYSNVLDLSFLYALDFIGNWDKGINITYNFRQKSEWFKILQDAGFVLEWAIHPALCHTGLLGLLTNKLQFISLWVRNDTHG